MRYALFVDLQLKLYFTLFCTTFSLKQQSNVLNNTNLKAYVFYNTMNHSLKTFRLTLSLNTFQYDNFKFKKKYFYSNLLKTSLAVNSFNF